MSQYQPVSLNTIRAAIMWGGLPTPRLKQVWVFAPPNVLPWSTVHAYFSLSEVCRLFSKRHNKYYGPDDLVPFRRLLMACFALDIWVTQLYVQPEKDTLVAMLTCSVQENDADLLAEQKRLYEAFNRPAGAAWLDPVDPFQLLDGHE